MNHTVTLADRHPRRVSLTRKALMMSCASVALATAALAPQSAKAQAFQGSVNGTTGSVTRGSFTATTETITVGSNTATINWTPTDQQIGGGTINFLPNGNTATFTSTPGITDYTVLNRIIPTDLSRGISLNGHVISTLQGTSATGGRVWFYSPGGIVIGASAVFDVGGLLLTTNDVTSFSTSANGFSATFGGPANSTSQVQIQSGAQINAIQPGSYVALVAPRIEQGGTVRVNGSAAYAAGEQLTMTMNQGLFDIAMDVGTGDSNGIVHTGTTSGPANTAASDNHSIYMVAVPKNQALTMLLSGGTIGFDAATASVENGQIILSAGQNVSGTTFDNDWQGGAIAGSPAAITISGGHYTSSVTGRATGGIVASGGGGTLTFDRDLTLQGIFAAALIASDGETITVHGDARISADDLRDFDVEDSNLGLDASGGQAEIRAETGGTVNIDGAATVTANASPATNFGTLTGGTSDGGTALIDARGGNINIGGATQVSATAFGDGVSHAGIDGRDSWGGDAEVSATAGGSVHIAGTVDVIADGDGSASALTSGGTGGTGYGGYAAVWADGNATVDIAGVTFVSASGIGGSLISSPDGTGGDGVGGTITLDSTFGANLTFGSNADFLANGIGAASQAQGGQGEGGYADMLIDGGSIAANGYLAMWADGVGGSGQEAGSGTGGETFGEITGGEGIGGGGSLTVAGDFRIQASGHGGNGASNAEGTGGDGGDGDGGYAWFYVSPFQDSEAALTVHLADVSISANGEGGAGGDGLTGGNGGSGYWGSSAFELYTGSATTGNLDVFATARGGNGGSGSDGAGGSGGDAYGGDSNIAIGGNLAATRALSYDRAFAGNGGSGTTQGDGGFAQGGDASIDVIDGGHLTGDVDIATTAFGGSGNTGGEADGGYSSLYVEGSLTGGSIAIDGTATGGAGVIQGGDAWGGSATFDVFGGSATIGSVAVLHADAIGGNASNGSGGYASGGGFENGAGATIDVFSGGSLTGGNLTATANASGGNGTFAGSADGGTVELFADSSGSEVPTTIALNGVNLGARGIIGIGATGETSGNGGFVNVLTTGASIGATSLSVQASGSTAGGFIQLGSDSDYYGQAGTLLLGSLDALANGGDWGGYIFVSSGPGSIVGLGNATLGASGGFGGQIDLLAGAGCDCGGEGEAAAQAATLPAGGGIAANNLTLTTSGDIFMSLSSGADIAVTNTLVGNAGETISLFDDGSGGAIRAHEIDLSAISILDSADIIADIIRFSAASDMDLGNLSATDTINLNAGGDLTTGDLSAGNIDLSSGGDITFGNLTGDQSNFNADGSVTGGNINVTTAASGSAEGAIVLGNITAGPNVPAGNDFSVGMRSATSITVGNVTGAGHVGFATLGDLTTGNLTAGDLVMLLVGGDIDTGSITTSASGRVYLADASMFLTGGGSGDDGEGHNNFDPNIVLALTPVATGGSITINGPVTTGRMQASAGGDLTTGNVTAGTDLTLSAGGLATFGGIVSAPTITVTSSDLDVTAGASLGVSGVTNLITLNAVSHGLPIVIGDDGSESGGASGQYHLNEDGDIRSAAVVVNAVGAVEGFAPDVQLFDLQIEGSTTAGGGVGAVTFNTDGSVFVNGDVHFINAGASDTMTINAGHAIEVNTDTGSIVMTDSAGLLAGTLDLNADNVWVGSGTVLGQLETDPNFAGRDAALGTNSGTTNPDGFVRAGTITAAVANSFLVQNSGTPDLFAGIDTGAGGLSIASTGTTPATLIVYGRQTNADGTTITNQDFLGSVDLSGTGGFTDDSAVNGCTIGSTCGTTEPILTLDSSTVLGPIGEANDDTDKDDDSDDSDDNSDGSKVDPNLRLINTTPINLDRQIDEPVTSGGDVVVGGGPTE